MYLGGSGSLLFTGCSLLGKPGHVVDDGGDVGGSIELDGLQGLVVGLDHSLDPSTVGVVPLAVQWELVRHLVSDFATKTKCREKLVPEKRNKQQLYACLHEQTNIS